METQNMWNINNKRNSNFKAYFYNSIEYMYTFTLHLTCLVIKKYRSFAGCGGTCLKSPKARRSQVQGQPTKQDPILRKKSGAGGWHLGGSWVVEHLLSLCKAMGSMPSTPITPTWDTTQCIYFLFFFYLFFFNSVF